MILAFPGPEVIKLFSCSTQLSTKFQLLIILKYRQIKKKFLALSLSSVVFIMLINVKMPTSVGSLTFMSRISFVLSCGSEAELSMTKSFITSGPGHIHLFHIFKQHILVLLFSMLRVVVFSS